MKIYTDGGNAFYVNNEFSLNRRDQTIALYFEDGKLYCAQTLVGTADTWGKPCDSLPFNAE